MLVANTTLNNEQFEDIQKLCGAHLITSHRLLIEESKVGVQAFFIGLVLALPIGIAVGCALTHRSVHLEARREAILKLLSTFLEEELSALLQTSGLLSLEVLNARLPLTWRSESLRRKIDSIRRRANWSALSALRASERFEKIRVQRRRAFSPTALTDYLGESGERTLRPGDRGAGRTKGPSHNPARSYLERPPSKSKRTDEWIPLLDGELREAL